MENQQSPLKKYRSRMTSLTKDWKTFMYGYDDPPVRAAAYDMTQRYHQMNATINSHFLLDAFKLYYNPYDTLVPNPIGKNPWKDIIMNELADKAYRELNEKTAHNPSLALLASQNFIDGMVKVSMKANNMIPPDIQEQLDKLKQSQQPGGQQQSQQNRQNKQNQQNNQQQSGGQGQGGQQPGGQQQGGQNPFNLGNFLNALQLMQTGNYGNQNAANNIMSQIENAVSNATQESNKMGMVMSGFSHTGIPMRKLMDVDEMRELLSNYIVIALSNALRKISVTDPGKSTSKPSPKRGIPIGVKTIRSFSEITDLIPMEYLNDQDLFAYRVVGMKARVRERFSSMNKYMVYVDKSGSMGGTMKFMDDVAPKIAVATANAISLARYLKTHGGSLTLKFFDTEVQEPLTDMWEILKTLSSVKADGGTDISNVLEDIADNGKEHKCIIVSDGIDGIDEKSAAAVSGMDVASILIGTTNPILEKYTKVTRVSEAGSTNMFLEV